MSAAVCSHLDTIEFTELPAPIDGSRVRNRMIALDGNTIAGFEMEIRSTSRK
jgi:hypothetical protein